MVSPTNTVLLGMAACDLATIIIPAPWSVLTSSSAVSTFSAVSAAAESATYHHHYRPHCQHHHHHNQQQQHHHYNHHNNAYYYYHGHYHFSSHPHEYHPYKHDPSCSPPLARYFFLYTLGRHDTSSWTVLSCYLFEFMQETAPQIFHTASNWLTLGEELGARS